MKSGTLELKGGKNFVVIIPLLISSDTVVVVECVKQHDCMVTENDGRESLMKIYNLSQVVSRSI